MRYLIALLLSCSTLMAAPPIGYNDPTIGGLVGWWTMNDAPGYSYAGPFDMIAWYKMDEGTGTLTTEDSSGNGNTGYLTNSPAWTNGVVGSGLQFLNPSKQFVYVNSFTAPSNSLSISYWVKILSIGSYYLALSKETTSPNTGFYSYIGPSNDSKPSFGFNVGSVEVLSTISLITNVWYLVSATFDGTAQIMYINGIANKTNVTSTVPIPNNNGLCLGSKKPAAQSDYLNGYLDDVRIYNRALSSDEILKLYNGGYGSQK